MSRSHTGGPTRSPGAKAWIGHAQLSTVGRAALGPRPHLRKSQRRRRLCLQRSCPMLTPRKGHDTKPCSLPTGHLRCWCPGLTAPLSHVLPTVGDDHLLLGLPVLAALGLCGPNRRGGIRGGRLESKGGSGTPTPLPVPPPTPQQQLVVSLQAPIQLSHIHGCAPGALAATHLNLPQDVQAIRDLPKHYMLAVQPIRLVTRQEELGAVGVWAGVGHGEQAWGREAPVSSPDPAGGPGRGGRSADAASAPADGRANGMRSRSRLWAGWRRVPSVGQWHLKSV